YYITTPTIMHLLKQKSLIRLLIIMIQKEVAERIVAKPGTKQYGALSIACQYHCEVELIAWVPKQVFFPQPKVDSALIRMTVWKGPRVKVEDEDFFFSLVRGSFGQRRKMLENALLGDNNLGFGKDKLHRLLKEAGIDGRRRAETLSIVEFARLSNTLSR
ncbi:16S rRNA (adenine(1518)-N(6)/adenine(1519)-N(6))-dimethyltransferase, partial [bacterium]|nr:16S rRNA (adenine(1518)-N(6)/adenine(1519)-N(6))-dimethyltransferase [bacterium]